MQGRRFVGFLIDKTNTLRMLSLWTPVGVCGMVSESERDAALLQYLGLAGLLELPQDESAGIDVEVYAGPGLLFGQQAHKEMPGRPKFP